jgi:hypothetical protein
MCDDLFSSIVRDDHFSTHGPAFLPRGGKSKRYYDAVERLKKKSQQKVDVVQKLLPSVPDQVSR